MFMHLNFYKIRRINIRPANRACRLEKNKTITSVAFFLIPLLKIAVMPAQTAQIVSRKPISVRSIWINPWRAKKSVVKIKNNIIKVVEMPDKNDQ